MTQGGWSVFLKVICFEPLGQGVLLNMLNILVSSCLVELRRFSRSTGFRNLEERRTAPSGDEDASPFGEEEENLPPSGTERGRPPSGVKEGRLVGRGLVLVRGDLKDASGPLTEGR